MNRKTLAIILLQALIIVVMFWLLVFYGKDEYEAFSQKAQEEQIETPTRVSSAEGATVVTLSKEVQAQSGVAVSPLQASRFHSTAAIYGTVVNLEGYNDLRSRYLAARAESEVVKASLANTRKEYQRVLQLNQDDHNVSDRTLAAAETAMKSDEARLAAAETAATSLRDTLRQQWGETLAGWAMQAATGGELQALQSRREVLVQITLPPGVAAESVMPALSVAPAGGRHPVPAQYVSAAPQADATLNGQTYFFRVPATDLRVGMRISAQWPTSGKTAEGVVVPDSAVVWYDGKAWVYQKQAEDRFVRRPVNTEEESGNGWFNQGVLKSGDEVVTSGAQLLLSEEFKYQITNENED